MYQKIWQEIAKAGINGTSEAWTTYMNMRAIAKASKMEASALEAQGRLGVYQTQQQLGYLGQQSASQIWQAYEQGEAFVGAQSAQLGASGFTDVSTGDKRLFADTMRKTQATVEGINASTNAQTFEAWRGAMMQDAYYRGQDKLRRATAKYNSGWRRRANAFAMGNLAATESMVSGMGNMMGGKGGSGSFTPSNFANFDFGSVAGAASSAA